MPTCRTARSTGRSTARPTRSRNGQRMICSPAAGGDQPDPPPAIRQTRAECGLAPGPPGVAGPGRRLPIEGNAAGENQKASQFNNADDCFGQDLRQAMFHGSSTVQGRLDQQRDVARRFGKAGRQAAALLIFRSGHRLETSPRPHRAPVNSTPRARGGRAGRQPNLYKE